MKIPAHFSLGKLLGLTMKTVRERMEANLKESDIEIPIDQFIILKILNNFDDVNQQFCANILKMDKSLFLRKLDPLQEGKFVARIPDPNDKRRNQLVLTKKGLEQLQKMEPIERKTMAELLDNISQEEFETFTKVLQTIQINAQNKQ